MFYFSYVKEIRTMTLIWSRPVPCRAVLCSAAFEKRLAFGPLFAVLATSSKFYFSEQLLNEI